MTTYKIQWRLPEFRHALNDDMKWKDINGEAFHLREHAELRKSSYWEKEISALEFRVLDTSPP